MAKGRRKKDRSTGIISSLPAIAPDATVAPGSPTERTISWSFDSESTNAPAIGEASTEPTYATTPAQLLERYMQGRIPVRIRYVFFLLLLGWFGFISWLYLQDNSAGKLATFDGIKWFGAKALAYTGFTLLVGAALVGVSWLSNRLDGGKRVSQ